MLRPPAVADQFYPGNPAVLAREVQGYLEKNVSKQTARGVVAPHAGYMYSGKVAGSVYSRIRIPERVVLLGVNHRGIGSRVAVMRDGSWDMPNGRVELDSVMADRLVAHCPLMKVDAEAHRYEHSLEVQLPFIQGIRSDFKLTPVALSFLKYSDCVSIGHALAQSIEEIGDPTLIVASSDMTHYESQEAAGRKDRMAMDRIKAMDPEGLYRTVVDHGISMCGVIPVTITLLACLELGAENSDLTAYATSGDATGDYGQVVGYAGFIIH
ncbi:MAG: AmmeMemoRadiSam system protein B [Deltaproteobacteria bacterium]|nr:AmmeMemoRadiSam system protein B [Deltaproteobacteria bacterium]